MTHGLGVSPALYPPTNAADDLAAKRVLEVQGEMRDAKRVAHRAGAPDGLGRATGLGPVGALVGPELERYRHDLRAAVSFGKGRNRGIHAARNGHKHAFGSVSAGDRLARRCERAQRAGERISYEVGGVPALRPQAADCRSDLFSGNRSNPKRRGALSVLAGCRRACAERRAPLSGKTRLNYVAVHDPKRHPHEVAAGRPPGAAGV